ncbi:hypothetical protein LJY25_00390 [Hymenobacter sp. BT175]|uniref:hypothetical protein n=1 Tax=Hymenobacter translucens TaxID=2886507 RepID=UPI001D0EAEC1|nr:hypothetical protein [Hymenobacter translucens]MCC2544886.1 hypothetical protein [Hymenobacter translucens]
MEPSVLNQLFPPNPGGGGLRGDPYLWQELRGVFAHLQLPTRPDEIDALLPLLYRNLVGEPLVAGRQPLVERFQGGMSSGQVRYRLTIGWNRAFLFLKAKFWKLLPLKSQLLCIPGPRKPRYGRRCWGWRWVMPWASRLSSRVARPAAPTR